MLGLGATGLLCGGTVQISAGSLVSPTLVTNFDSLTLSQYASPLVVDGVNLVGAPTEEDPQGEGTIDVAHNSVFL